MAPDHKRARHAAACCLEIAVTDSDDYNLALAYENALKILGRLLIEAGEGSSRGRAIDLLPRKTVNAARAILTAARMKL